MLAKHYAKVLKKEIDPLGHVVFPPTANVQLGDIGELINGIFQYRGNLRQEGIQFEELKEEPQMKPLFLTSHDNVNYQNIITGQIPTKEDIGLIAAEAGLEIQFKQKNDVFFLLEGTQTVKIKNQIALEKEIERRFNMPNSGAELWDKKYVVVTEVVRAKRGTILIAKDQESAYRLNTKLAASMKPNDFEAELEIGRTAGSFAAGSLINADNVVAYFKLSKIKQEFFGLGQGSFTAVRGKTISEAKAQLHLEEVPAPSYSLPGEKIHVLGIGINKYKDGDTNDLRGCIKDVEDLQLTLTEQLDIPAKNYRLLRNEEATRDGIIRAFREHFADLEDGSVAVMHFSGHGSFEQASHHFTEDSNIEVGGGRHETLVCHDSNNHDIFDLADKEMRWLVYELQNPLDETTKKRERKNIHFLALLDCCHSGSMFRHSGKEYVGKRFKSGQAVKPRDIESFIGDYAEQTKHGTISLPSVNYLSLTACGPKQNAVETDLGGLFTQALVKVLKETTANIYCPSYADIFNYVRTVIKNNEYNEQTPFLEFAGHANPHSAFLHQGEVAERPFPTLDWDGERKQWRIALGAIHGITLESVKNMDIKVYERDNLSEAIGSVTPKVVQLEHTVVVEKPSTKLDKKSPNLYVAGLSGYQLPVRIHYEEDATEGLRKSLASTLEANKHQAYFSIQPPEVNNSNVVEFELRVSGQQIAIYRHKPKPDQLITGVRWKHNKLRQIGIDDVLEKLRCIACWEQINQLVTPKDSNIIEDRVNFIIRYKYDEGEWSQFPSNTNNFEPIGNTLTAEKSWSKEEDFPSICFHDPEEKIRLEFFVENDSGESLFHYLIYLHDQYEIHLLNTDNYSKEEEGRINLFSDNLVNDKNRKKELFKFLLISSKYELSVPYYFVETGVGLSEVYGRIIDVVQGRGLESIGVRSKDEHNHRANWQLKRLLFDLVYHDSV